MIQTAILFIKTHYAVCGTFAAAYLFNFILGRKSQIDSWCNANPKRAAIIKLIRGVLPCDRWLIVQAATVETTTETVEEKSIEKEAPIPPPPTT